MSQADVQPAYEATPIIEILSIDFELYVQLLKVESLLKKCL